MFIDAIGYNSEPSYSYEELRDQIELLIAEYVSTNKDYIATNNPVNITKCSSRIMLLCGIHAMQVANLLGAYDEVTLGVRDAFIEAAQQEDTWPEEE